MTERDQYGLALSTDSPAAAEAWRDALGRLCALQEATDALLRAVDADPGFAMPAVHLANNLRLQGDIAGATALLDGVDLTRANPREAANVDAMRVLMRGDPFVAMERLEAVLREFPTDAPLLSVLHRQYVNLCPTVDRRARHHAFVSSLESYYPAGDWYFLSELAYSTEEIGEFAHARTLAERALAGNPHSGEAAHALAHATYEQADPAGIDWLATWLQEWSSPSLFANHLRWHLGLFALDAGDTEQARRIAEDGASDAVAPAVLKLINWGSLFWRMCLDGVDPRELPWEVLASLRAPAFFPFAACHEAMVHAAIGDADGVQRVIDEQSARAEVDPAARVGAVVCDAMRAFAAGDPGGAARRLESVLGDLVVLGGSRAQQDVFEDTLAAAYLASGERTAARALLETRARRRPLARDVARVRQLSA